MVSLTVGDAAFHHATSFFLITGFAEWMRSAVTLRGGVEEILSSPSAVRQPTP